MTSPQFLAPGLIGLTQIAGAVGTGIRVGQYLNGDGFSKFEHAFMTLPGNLILEAEPGGSVIRPIHYPADTVHLCWNIREKLLPVLPTDRQLLSLASSLEHVPYSFLDYDALFCHRLHIPFPGLKDFIGDTGHMICSQLTDEFYQRLGAVIFSDDRWPGYVTPGALYRRDLELA